MDVSFVYLSLVLIATFRGLSARPLLHSIQMEETTRAEGTSSLGIPATINASLALTSSEDLAETSESSPSITSFQLLPEKSRTNPISTTSHEPSEKTKTDSPPQLESPTTSAMYDAPKQTSPCNSRSPLVSKPHVILFISIHTTTPQPMIQEERTSNMKDLDLLLPATSENIILKQIFPLISLIPTNSGGSETLPLSSHSQTWYLLFVTTPHLLLPNTTETVSQSYSESWQANPVINSSDTTKTSPIISQPAKTWTPRILTPTIWTLPSILYAISRNANLTLPDLTHPNSTIQVLTLPNATATPSMSPPISLSTAPSLIESKEEDLTSTPVSELSSATTIPTSTTPSLRHEDTTLDNRLETMNETKPISPSSQLRQGAPPSLTAVSFSAPLSSKQTLESWLERDPLTWLLMRTETRLAEGRLNWLFAKAAEKLQAWFSERATELDREEKLISLKHFVSTGILESTPSPLFSYTTTPLFFPVSSLSPPTDTSVFESQTTTLNNPNDKQNECNNILPLAPNFLLNERTQPDDTFPEQSLRKKILPDSVAWFLENDDGTSGFSINSEQPIKDVALMRPKHRSRSESNIWDSLTPILSSLLRDLLPQLVRTPRKQPLERKNTGDVVLPLLQPISSISSPEMRGTRTSLMYQLPSNEDEVPPKQQKRSVETFASVVPGASDFPSLPGFQSMNKYQPKSLSVSPNVSSPALTNRISLTTGFLFSLPSQRGSVKRMRSSQSTRVSLIRSSQMRGIDTTEHSGLTSFRRTLHSSRPRTTIPPSTRLPASTGFHCEKKMRPVVTFLTRRRSSSTTLSINKYIHGGSHPVSLPSPSGEKSASSSTLSVTATEATTIRPPLHSSTSAVPLRTAYAGDKTESTADN